MTDAYRFQTSYLAETMEAYCSYISLQHVSWWLDKVRVSSEKTQQ